MSLHITPRESQVIELLNAGLSQKEIAEVLHCTRGTVDTHIKNLKSKTGLQKSTELSCAYTWHRYKLPIIDLPEKVRKRIAAALLVLSLTGIIADVDFLRVLRPLQNVKNIMVNTVRRSKSETDFLILKTA